MSEHRKTSIDVYHRIEAEGLLSAVRFEVYSILFKYGPLTATCIASKMERYKSPSVGANVHARLGELRARGVVKEVGEGVCPLTGNTVLVFDVTENLPIEPDKLIAPTRSEIITGILECIDEILPAVCAKPRSAKWQKWVEDVQSWRKVASKYDKRQAGSRSR